MGIFQQFPYSNFHEYNLDELIKTVKQLVDDWAAYQLKWNNLYNDTEQALTDFKAYVQNYWETLDLTAEVATVLNNMLQAGDLDALIVSKLSPVVTSWLADNITQPVGVVIDNSLSVPGACADAWETGRRTLLNESNNSFTGLKWIEDSFVRENGLVNSSVGRIRTDFVPVIPNTTISYILESDKSNVAAVSFYKLDNQTTFISGEVNTGSAGVEHTCTVPADARYARFSSKKDLITHISFNISPIKKYMEQYIHETQTCFISPTGAGANLGTRTDPLNSIKNAVDRGFKKICMLRGEYDFPKKQLQNISNIDNLEIFADCNDIFDGQERAGVVLRNTHDIAKSAIIAENDYYKVAFSEQINAWVNVFINHTAPTEINIGSGRTSPSCGLWIHYPDKYQDHYLSCVLSIGALVNNSFYWDGTYIYFKIDDYINIESLFAIDSSDILHFTNCNNLKLSDLTLLGGVYSNCIIDNCDNVTINNCVSGYTMRSDGFRAVNSNITFNNCTSYKARNDGFNAHNYGISIYNNCRALHNLDDGESSHEFCEVVVNGGEYAYNAKGGHSPVHRCKFKASNTYSHDNGYGLYLRSTPDYQPSGYDEIAVCHGCVFKDNSSYDITIQKYTLKLIQSEYDTIENDNGTVINI